MSRPGADLALLLLGGFRSLANEATAELSRRGYDNLTPSIDFALRAIDGGGNSASELGRRLAVSKQAAAKTIAVLEQRGYITHDSASSDARRKPIKVTPLGRAALHEGEAIFDELRASWAKKIGAAELDKLEATLIALVGAKPIDLDAPGGLVSEIVRDSPGN